MSLTTHDHIKIKYMNKHRNDGIDGEICRHWFIRDINNDRWKDARWIELLEPFLSYDHALTHFLSSASVGHGLIRLDLPNLDISKEDIEALASNPDMTQLKVLHLGAIDGEPGALAPLLSSPHLKNLHTLSWSNYALDCEDVDALRTDGRQWHTLGINHIWSEGMENIFDAINDIDSLFMRDCVLTKQDTLHLASAPWLSTLRTLDLSNTTYEDNEGQHRLGLDYITTLFDQGGSHRLETLIYQDQQVIDEEQEPPNITLWPTFKHLHTLDLSQNTLEAKTLDQFLHHPVCGHLKSLTLNDCDVQPSHLETIGTVEHFSSLKRLNLSKNNAIGDIGAQYVAQSTTLTNLKSLHMANANVSIIGYRALQALESVDELHIGELILPPEAARLEDLDKMHFILESGMLDSSKVIDLSDMTFKTKFVECLANHQASSTIETLKLNRCELTDDMLVKLLSKPSKLTNLKKLYVDGNLLTHEIGERLESSNIIKNVTTLSIRNNALGCEAAESIMEQGEWDYLYFEGNESPEGDDIYDLIDDYWTSSIGDVIDLINERR